MKAIFCNRAVAVPVLWVLSVAAAVAVTWWAAANVMRPPTVESPVGGAPTVEVVEGTVGGKIRVPVFATWEFNPLAISGAAGTVTSIEIAPSQEVDVGDALYTVDLRPVVVAEGAVPMFRDLALKDTGADVKQLQQFLTELGHFSGKLDGTYNNETVAAVKAWQKALGSAQTGSVNAADILFVNSLPSRVLLSEDIRPGARVSIGEVTAFSISKYPEFEIRFEAGRSVFTPPDSKVTITAGDHVWQARPETTALDSFGTTIIPLSNPDGGSICQEECIDALPVSSTNNIKLSGELLTAAPATGPMVPQASIRSGAQGEMFVTSELGDLLPVTILESADGYAVVDGVAVGARIQLFGSTR